MRQLASAAAAFSRPLRLRFRLWGVGRLVSRLIWDQEIAGSNPVTPTHQGRLLPRCLSNPDREPERAGQPARSACAHPVLGCHS